MLAECGVTDEATLYSLARLLGGGKKRKKKTYTKPKKIKHKHKKIKLRVLKFYKVRALPLPRAEHFLSIAADSAAVCGWGCRSCRLSDCLVLCTTFGDHVGCRWTTRARCSGCARCALRPPAGPAPSWPPTSTASTGALFCCSHLGNCLSA